MSNVFTMQDWLERKRELDEVLFDKLKVVTLAEAIHHWRKSMKSSDTSLRNKRGIKTLIDFGIIKLRKEDNTIVTIGDFYNRDQNSFFKAIKTMTGEHLRCEHRKDYYLAYLRFIDYLHQLSGGLFGKEKMKMWICTKKCCSLSLWRKDFPISQELKRELLA